MPRKTKAKSAGRSTATREPARKGVKSAKDRPGSSASRSPSPAQPPGPAQPQAPAQANAPEQAQFVKGLLVRGEAARLTPDGKLPLDATHVIEKENEDGTAKVRRTRFKLF